MKEIWKTIILWLWLSSVESLELICVRRNEGVIFYDTEKNIFIRFWLKEYIKKEFEIQKKFINYNFDVPQILFNKEVDNNYFLYSEKNLWKEPIWIEIKQKVISYKEWFSNLYNVFEKFSISQKETINNKWNIEELKDNLNIEKFKKESLELGIFNINFIEELYKKIFNDIQEKGIYCLTHWDFNSRNIFKNWFIDVEDSYNGLLWYDLITLTTHLYWFEISWKRSISFSFEVSDIKKLFKLYNNIFSTKIEDTFTFLFLLRWIWACSWMWKFPEEQKYRFNRFKKYADKYLKWENILESFFDEVDKVNNILKAK